MGYTNNIMISKEIFNQFNTFETGQFVKFKKDVNRLNSKEFREYQPSKSKPKTRKFKRLK